MLIWQDQGAPPLSPLAAFAAAALSCRRGRWPQPGDQRQDVGEHLSRHRDLGHLECDVSAVTDDLRTDFNQLLSPAS